MMFRIGVALGIYLTSILYDYLSPKILMIDWFRALLFALVAMILLLIIPKDLLIDNKKV